MRTSTASPTPTTPAASSSRCGAGAYALAPVLWCRSSAAGHAGGGGDGGGGAAPVLPPPPPPHLRALAAPGPQGDTFKQDAALFVGVVMLFWGLVQAWASLFSGSSGGGGAF